MTNQRDQNKDKSASDQQTQKPEQGKSEQREPEQALLKPYEANPTKVGKQSAKKH